MALTALIVICLLFFSICAIVVGWYFVNRELFYLGIVLLLFMGLSILSDGFQIVTSETNTGSLLSVSNGTVVDTLTTYNYSSQKDITTNGIGLLFVVIAAGASLNFQNRKKKKEDEKHESMDV